MTRQPVVASWPADVTLAEYKLRINDALIAFFNELPSKLALDLSLASRDALEKLREYTLRPGKRIRGSLAAASYDGAAKESFGEAGILLGVALELMQSYLLIVDDVMDRSVLRRGLPTIHKLYADTDDSLGGSDEANMMAINVGLIAQHVANRALLGAPESSKRILGAMHSMHHNITATGFGQLDDLYQRAGRAVTEQDIIRKYCYKSSYYTFINPLECGLVLGGMMSDDAHRGVVAFGEAAGIAFQLHDDLLGVFGEVSATGKSNADDIQEGTYTVLVRYALEYASPEEIAELRCALGNKHLESAGMARIRAIFERAGAAEFVRGEVRRYARLARGELAKSPIWDDGFKAKLADLLDYTVMRRS